MKQGGAPRDISHYLSMISADVDNELFWLLFLVALKVFVFRLVYRLQIYSYFWLLTNLDYMGGNPGHSDSHNRGFEFILSPGYLFLDFNH